MTGRALAVRRSSTAIQMLSRPAHGTLEALQSTTT
jgi:hypothetical protein